MRSNIGRFMSFRIGNSSISLKMLPATLLVLVVFHVLSGCGSGPAAGAVCVTARSPHNHLPWLRHKPIHFHLHLFAPQRTRFLPHPHRALLPTSRCTLMNILAARQTPSWQPYYDERP
jgi:hypothetical protein